MPITAGDAAPGAAMKAEITDYAKALEVVKTYTTADGLDADTLLDSDKHGALTYNDFLILPGYIGKPNPEVKEKISCFFLTRYRLPRFRCLIGYPCYQAYLPEDPSSVLAHGHCHRAQHGYPHGSARWSRCYPPQLLSRGPGGDGP
mgnify:FL=1|jgi:hypothetical protein